MSLPVRFEDEAEGELESAAAWYERQRPGLSGDLRAEVERALAHLRDMPRACQLAPGLPAGLDVRRFPVHRFPYWVVFMKLPDEVHVVAFAHQRRLPAYWHGRLH